MLLENLQIRLYHASTRKPTAIVNWQTRSGLAELGTELSGRERNWEIVSLGGAEQAVLVFGTGV